MVLTSVPNKHEKNSQNKMSEIQIESFVNKAVTPNKNEKPPNGKPQE